MGPLVYTLVLVKVKSGVRKKIGVVPQNYFSQCFFQGFLQVVPKIKPRPPCFLWFERGPLIRTFHPFSDQITFLAFFPCLYFPYNLQGITPPRPSENEIRALVINFLFFRGRTKLFSQISSFFKIFHFFSFSRFSKFLVLVSVLSRD